MSTELSKEEQAIFDSMQKEEAPPPPKQEERVEAKAEAKGEQKAEVKAEVKDPQKEQQKVVPAEALAEARAQNKELRKELDGLRGLVAEGDKKLQKLVESIATSAAGGPKFEDDPAAHLKHENDQLRKGLSELQEKITRQEAAGHQNAKVNEHAAVVTAREAAFHKEHPDYYKAAEYVAQMWREEFQEAGFEDAEIPKLVFAKSLGITSKAVQAGKDPAAIIYNTAKRYGFAAPKQEEKKSDGESKLKQLEKGLEAAKGNSGGGGGPDDMTLASLAQMDDGQIEKLVQDKDWWAKNIRRSVL